MTILEQRFAYNTKVGAIDKTILIVVIRDDHRNGIRIPGNGISYSHLESHGNPVGMGIIPIISSCDSCEWDVQRRVYMR